VIDFVVLAVGSLVPSLALPNEVFPDGVAFLGPLFLVPVFWFTARHGPGLSAFGGALWIVLVTLLSQFWLLSFHPLAFPLVLAFQVPWYAAAFGFSSFLWRRFPRSGLWFQALGWTFFEFIRVQGFFSYPYGALATAFWSWPLTFQSADVVGTSGLTFLLAWASAWLAAVGSRSVPWKRLRLDLAAGLVLWAVDLGYGLWHWNRPELGALWRPALIQQSQDPWRGGSSAYEAGFERLEELSRKALQGHPDAVIWSETAFVPSVEYHKRYHDNADSLELVRRLEDFLASTHVPFLLGNDHREKADDGTIRDYNAVLSWNGGWSGRYEKNRLVPFTESFPYKEQLPWVYQWLKDADTHFWEPGRGRTILQAGSVAVGTPVCFEDAFPDGARSFSLGGARALVNLTNDSWASGTASRMQHLSLAVFRTVETRLPLVRAGNDGATAAVSLRGEVLSRLPVGPPGTLQAEVRLGSGTPTVYTRSGDWFSWISGVFLAVGVILTFRRRSDVDKA
jgi:apolipoprotein N-acyltransferase